MCIFFYLLLFLACRNKSTVCVYVCVCVCVFHLRSAVDDDDNDDEDDYDDNGVDYNNTPYFSIDNARVIYTEKV